MVIGPSCFDFISYFEALGFGIQFLPHELYSDRYSVVMRLRTADYLGIKRAVMEYLFIYCWDVVVNNPRQFTCERGLI
jgi:hypothetical protein